MKEFHISDVLSVTTGRLVSSRHMDGVYDILNFLTSDDLFTHQLPRAVRECEPWLRTQFPQLMEDAPGILPMLDVLRNRIAAVSGDKEAIGAVCAAWVEEIRTSLNMPEMLPVYEMGAEMHTVIDPITEAQAMIGDKKVIKVRP